MTQSKIFLDKEADAWFKRNSSTVECCNADDNLKDIKYLCNELENHKSEIKNIIEIGSSNGIKLEKVCRYFNASGVGIDPSGDAIDSGNLRIQQDLNIKLYKGTGTNIPFKTQCFDLVIFGFCLYLFDREELLSSIAEADRILRRGGFLIITDFDPGIRYRRNYVYSEDLFSFKQNYASILIETGMYYLVSKHSFSHSKNYFDVNKDERVSTSILYKENEAYPLVD